MDPNAWISFIQRALQSAETLSFFIFGTALGGIVGFILGRWLASHTANLRDLQDRLAERDRELDKFRGELVLKDPGDTNPRGNTNAKARGDLTPPVMRPPGDPLKDRVWETIATLLAARGIEQHLLVSLRKSLQGINKKIIDSDNRPRIMVWRNGTRSIPVAMIWRSAKNPRVLLPDGKVTNVGAEQLEEILDNP